MPRSTYWMNAVSFALACFNGCFLGRGRVVADANEEDVTDDGGGEGRSGTRKPPAAVVSVAITMSGEFIADWGKTEFVHDSTRG